MKALTLLAAAALVASCSNSVEVTGGDPAVHDQLNSRGYIVTPDDTIPRPKDDGLELDSL